MSTPYIGSRLLLSFLCVISVFLCNLRGALGETSPPDSVLAEKVIQSIPEGEIKRLEKEGTPDELRETQRILLDHFKTANPVKILGLQVHLLKITHEMHLSPPNRDTNYNYELEYLGGSRHLVLLTVRNYKDGSVDYALASRLEGAILNPTFWSIAKQYILRDGFLVLAFLIPIFMFAMAYICFRTRPPWRLFWLIFIFVGFFRIDMNWSNGAVNVLPLQVIFFGFQVKQMFIEGVGPGQWMVSISLPIGALLFLVFWKKQKT